MCLLVVSGCAMAQSADFSPVQQVDATANSASSSEQLPDHPEYRSTASGILISYSLSDADAEEMLLIVRQHTQDNILGIILNTDGSVSVSAGIENRNGTTYEFLHDSGKWKLTRQWEWIS